MTGSKKYRPVVTKAQPRVGFDFLSEKIIHTQIPEFWNPMVKMVELGFSLITVWTQIIRYTIPPVSSNLLNNCPPGTPALHLLQNKNLKQNAVPLLFSPLQPLLALTFCDNLPFFSSFFVKGDFLKKKSSTGLWDLWDIRPLPCLRHAPPSRTCCSSASARRRGTVLSAVALPALHFVFKTMFKTFCQPSSG